MTPKLTVGRLIDRMRETLELVECTGPDVRFSATIGGGTYLRSLARDVGEARVHQISRRDSSRSRSRSMRCMISSVMRPALRISTIASLVPATLAEFVILPDEIEVAPSRKDAHERRDVEVGPANGCAVW